MNKNDGGSAFPFHHDYADGYETSDGMSLRDYFAAKAMQALLRVDTDNGRLRTRGDAIRTSLFAYDVADAMLAEREK